MPSSNRAVAFDSTQLDEWCSALDSASSFLRTNRPPAPPPNKEHLAFSLKQVRRTLRQVRESKDGADSSSLTAALDSIRDFLDDGDCASEDWVVLMDVALVCLRSALDILPESDTDDQTTESDEQFDYQSSNSSCSSALDWIATEQELTEFVQQNSAYPRRANASRCRQLLTRAAEILQEIQTDDESVQDVIDGFLYMVKDLLEKETSEIVKIWPRENSQPLWIQVLGDVSAFLRSLMLSSVEDSDVELKEIVPVSLQFEDLLDPIPRFNFNLPRKWQRCPLRINPCALPPLPAISLSHYSQIFGDHSSSDPFPTRPGCEAWRPLDFRGDALLGHLVTKILCRAFPTIRNGSLTCLRSLLVRNTTLSNLAWHYSFHTKLAHHIPIQDLDQKEMADLFEAFLGALALDSPRGERHAEDWISEVFTPAVFTDAMSVAVIGGERDVLMHVPRQRKRIYPHSRRLPPQG
ncbi:hypothetical protein T439DRAFT_379728 [Meredithblackwellia eburnea MCA 4105]